MTVEIKPHELPGAVGDEQWPPVEVVIGGKAETCLIGCDGLGGVVVLEASDWFKGYCKGGDTQVIFKDYRRLKEAVYQLSVSVVEDDCDCGDCLDQSDEQVCNIPLVEVRFVERLATNLTFTPMSDRDRAETAGNTNTPETPVTITPEPVSTPSITGESVKGSKQYQTGLTLVGDGEGGARLLSVAEMSYVPGLYGVPTLELVEELSLKEGDWVQSSPPDSAEERKAGVMQAIGGSHEVAKVGQRDGLDIRPGGVRRDDAKDAARYRWLRSRDVDAIGQGGVFAGLTPDNLVLSGVDLDRAVDEARGHDEPVDLDAVLIQGLDRALEAARAEGNQSMIDTFTHMKAAAARSINGPD